MPAARPRIVHVTTDGLLADTRRALVARYGDERGEFWFAAIGRALANPRPAFLRLTAKVPLDPAPAPRIAILEDLMNQAEHGLPCSARFHWSASLSARRSELQVARRLVRERRRPLLLARVGAALRDAFPDRGGELAEILTDRLDRAGWFPEEREPLTFSRARHPVESLPPHVLDLANRLEPERGGVLWQLETNSHHSDLLWTLIASWPRTRRR